MLDARWIGNGICYGPYRDGQRPGGPQPSREQLRDDLRILRPHWRLLRMYGSRGPTEAVVELIQEERMAMKVMLGVWIEPEARQAANGAAETVAEAVAANRAEVETAVRLANAYPEVVIAVSVGNETQVSWSSHKVAPDTLIGYIRHVRSNTRVPISVADDFSYWNQPDSRRIAGELDFLVMHVYAMWWGRSLEQALPFTREKYAEVLAMHPGQAIVIGETGWATRRHSEGEQARLMAGVAGEHEQKRFHAQLVGWTAHERIPTFFFEAFDENWKGGAHPDEVEKHWGLFRADRSPKQAVLETRP